LKIIKQLIVKIPPTNLNTSSRNSFSHSEKEKMRELRKISLQLSKKQKIQSKVFLRPGNICENIFLNLKKVVEKISLNFHEN
jgi:hypothetical protein